MHIFKARFFQYRNLDGTVELSPLVNVFLGRNGQGKTNVLEAIHVACYGRSFRQGKLQDVVSFEKQEARVDLDVSADSTSVPISVTISNKGKSHSVGGKENATVDDVGKYLRTVFFGPDDMQLVKGSKNLRRDFLDEAIWAHYPPFARVMKGYQRLLKERNQLLRDLGANRHPPFELMESFEGELARYGAMILDYRIRYLREFTPLAVEFVRRHTEEHLELTIEMDSSVPVQQGDVDVSGLTRALLKAIVEARALDIANGWTSVGPHVDDLELKLNGKAARFFASQGEQRQVAVAFKLAQLAVWRLKLSVSPVLLLDDVASELDEKRSRTLFSTIADWGIQSLLTTTVRPDVLIGEGHRVFEVSGGRIAPEAQEQVE